MAAFAAIALSVSGCLAYKAVTAPVKLAATTVITATEAAGAIVTNTGKLTVSAARAIGNVGSSGIDAAAQLAQTGMVTFVDPDSGTVTRIAWREGLTLASAGDAAKLELARKTVDVIRAGKLAYKAKAAEAAASALASGDVVRIRR